MPVPASSIAPRPFRFLPLLLLVLSASLALAAARPPETRIPLESLGYIPFSAPVLASGASILSINYVDDRHLLVTFSVRRLLPRIPDDPPEDFDRSIDAVLVDLPSGQVLARTAWRVHDPAQYLWPLGNGHFLLRIRDRLTTLSPLANLKSGDAFKEHAFLSSPRPIGAVLLSPDSSLLILESLDRRPAAEPERTPSPGTQAYAAKAAQKDAPETPPRSRMPVEIHFYRIRSQPSDGELFAQASGGLRARTLVTIPADGAGFLSILDQGNQHWAFNYNLYRGKVEELSPFDSTCHPLPILVSRSEFIAFGCRSGSQRQMFGGFNLRGEEMWEQAIPENYLNPTFAFAPATGRFAFGRVTTALSVGDQALANAALSTGQFSAQTVTVFQTDSGKPVLRLDCTPILPSGQNFDLSPDGSSLAILRESVIEIHNLPPPSAKDRAGIAKAASLAPELSDGPILLTAPLTNANARAATSAGTPVPTPPTDPASHRPSAIVDSSTVAPEPSESQTTSTVDSARTPPADDSTPGAAAPPSAEAHTADPVATSPQPAQSPARSIENGDPEPQADTPRKPPTLYNPGEQPEAKPDKSRTDKHSSPK